MENTGPQQQATKGHSAASCKSAPGSLALVFKHRQRQAGSLICLCSLLSCIGRAGRPIRLAACLSRRSCLVLPRAGAILRCSACPLCLCASLGSCQLLHGRVGGGHCRDRRCCLCPLSSLERHCSPLLLQRGILTCRRLSRRGRVRLLWYCRCCTLCLLPSCLLSNGLLLSCCLSSHRLLSYCAVGSTAGSTASGSWLSSCCVHSWPAERAVRGGWCSDTAVARLRNPRPSTRQAASHTCDVQAAV